MKVLSDGLAPGNNLSDSLIQIYVLAIFLVRVLVILLLTIILIVIKLLLLGLRLLALLFLFLLVDVASNDHFALNLVGLLLIVFDELLRFLYFAFQILDVGLGLLSHLLEMLTFKFILLDQLNLLLLLEGTLSHKVPVLKNSLIPICSIFS